MPDYLTATEVAQRMDKTADIPVRAWKDQAVVVTWYADDGEILGEQRITIDGKFLPPITGTVHASLEGVELR